MKMRQLRDEKKIYRELERMRKSRTFESSTDRTGQEPDDFLNMSFTGIVNYYGTNYRVVNGQVQF